MRRRIDTTTLVMWLIGILIVVGVGWGTYNTIRANPYSRENWIDFVIFGLAQGCLYALIALGYTLVYGILRMMACCWWRWWRWRHPSLLPFS